MCGTLGWASPYKILWSTLRGFSNSKRRLRSYKRPCLLIEYERSLRFRHHISRGTQNLGCFLVLISRWFVSLSFRRRWRKVGLYQPCPFLQEMDMVDTDRPTSAKQEIEMRQEIVPFGQNSHGTVQLCSKTRTYPAITKVKIVWMWIESFFLPWIRNHYFEATRRHAESVQSVHYKAVEQRGRICRLDQVKWNSGKGSESTEFQVLRRL